MIIRICSYRFRKYLKLIKYYLESKSHFLSQKWLRHDKDLFEKPFKERNSQTINSKKKN